ncbi:MAG: ABC transporter permease [Spirochaetales bacterium]|nr:ABC transporter permease [Spirochaetales bacterium]
MAIKDLTRDLTKRIASSHIKWSLIIFFVILLFNFIFTPNFFHIEIKNGRFYGSIIDVFNRAAPVMLAAIGMTLVIATGGIDISVGSVMAISGSIAAVLIAKMDVPFWMVLCLPLVFSALLGAWNGLLVSYIGIQPIIATLILLVAGRGIAQLVTDGQIIVFEHPPFEFIAGGSLFGLHFPIIISFGVFLIILFLFKFTALGLFVESVGGNSEASKYCGINAGRIKLVVYIVSALCAGIAGLIAASNIKAADPNTSGDGLELNAILAVVIGGTSLNGGKYFLVGSVIGALIMQSLTTTILTMGVPVQVTLVVNAIVVLVVCLIQSKNFRDILAGIFKLDFRGLLRRMPLKGGNK